MVLRRSEEANNSMAATTTPKISNRLHNFSLPFLKWGTQRHMRCTTVGFNDAAGASGSGDRGNSNSDESTMTRNHASGSNSNSKSKSKSKQRLHGGRGCDNNNNNDGEEAIAVVREKLTLDLKAAADRMKEAIFRNEDKKQEEDCEREPETVKSWNLRTRRTECKAAAAVVENERDCSSPARVSSAVKLTRSRRTDLENTETRRAKFSVPLSRREVEEDFMAMFGHRPPRRPNKRPKIVQKQLDCVFPGLWLMEVTADMYKVLDTNGNGKVAKRKGRKGKDASP